MIGFKSFCENRSGAVAVTAAVAIPVLLGFVALVAEFGNGILVKSQTQRIADSAAYAAAVNYSTSNSTTSMNAVAQNVAVLNGLTAQSVTASIVQSPSNASNQAVLVNMATSLNMLVAPVLGFQNTLPVSSNSYVAISSSAPPTGCMIALNPAGTGITLSGSGTISAAGCTVASNQSLNVPCGTFITAKTVTYGASAPTVGCSGITGAVSKSSTSDPFSNNQNVGTSGSRAGGLNLSDPSSPNVPNGRDVNLSWDDGANEDLNKIGCSGSFSNNTWTVNCPSGGTYNFGSVSVGGGISVNFATAASAATTFNFSGNVSNLGSSMSFGPGTYNMKNGLYLGGATNTTFSGGTFNFGAGSQSCSDGKHYSICHLGSSLVFTKASTFNFTSGVYVNGGATLRMGTSGSTNVYNIGSQNSNGYALNVGGGATVVLGDATSFSLNGSVTESGGSCVTLPASSYHDIDGSMNVMGGLTMGAGHYALNGYFAAGAAYGGDVSCNGSMVGVNASNVSIAVSGASLISGGSCNGMSFCINAGFSNVTIKAPTSGTFANLAVIGPQSSSIKGGVSIAEGASNTGISGLFYFPNGPLTISGAASIGNGSGDCLQIIASQITLSGSGRATTSQCASGSGSGSSSSSTVGFVQ